MQSSNHSLLRRGLCGLNQIRNSTAAPNTTWTNVGSQDPLDTLMLLMRFSNSALLRSAEDTCAFISAVNALSREYAKRRLCQLMYENNKKVTVATTF